MTGDNFSLAEILAVAKLHPFYNSQSKYPPSKKNLSAVCEEAKRHAENANLQAHPLLHKKDM